MHRLSVIFLLILAVGLVTADTKPRHIYSMTDAPAYVTRPSGNITRVTVNELPVLQRLSMQYLTLQALGVVEPYWYSNAHTLAYCLSGFTRVSIFGNAAERSIFTITAGDMFFVPAGYLYSIENLGGSGQSPIAQFIVAFSHESPEDFGISRVFSAMSNAVLGNTYQLPSSAFQSLKRSPNATVIGTMDLPNSNVTDQSDSYVSRFKFAAESMQPPVNVAEGSAKTITQAFWSILQDISMYSLRMAASSMREPHWHPQTAEMGYIVTGSARMTVLLPGVQQDLSTYILKQGDMYFIPRGYPHHIEMVNSEDTHFLVFFDQAIPFDIGITGSISTFPRPVLAASLQYSLNQLPNFPFYPQDLLLVQRINPIDP